MEMMSILSEVDLQTLVVFDIDYTLYRPTTNLGTPEWIYYLATQEMNKGLSQIEAFQKCYPLWLKTQHIINLELMDPNIPELLTFIERMSAGFIALTARRPETAKVTTLQLNKLGLKLDKTEVSNLPVSFDFKNPVLFEKGILFGHELNDKGDVFVDWFKKVQLALSEENKITKVIFIDDVETNVLSMAKAANSLNLTYKGYYYSVANAFKEKFNPMLAEKEAYILRQDYSEAETKAHLQSILFEMEPNN